MKIAIVRLTSLGDVVFASFIPQLIKKYIYNNKDIIIDWICDKNFADIINHNPYINKIHSIPIRDLKKKKTTLQNVYKITKDIKKENYDIIIDIQGTLKSAIISKLISVSNSYRYGFSFFSAREKLATFFYHKTVKINYQTNIVERNLALINAVFKINASQISITNLLPTIFINKKDYTLPSQNNQSDSNEINDNIDNDQKTEIKKKFIENIANQNDINIDYIALLVPFSSSKKKDMKEELIYGLAKKFKNIYFFINYGSESEKARVDGIIENAKKLNIHNIDKINDKNSIVDMKFLILFIIDITIGVDSGITHLSSFCNLKTIVLFYQAKNVYRNIIQNNKSLSLLLKNDDNDYNTDLCLQSINNMINII